MDRKLFLEDILCDAVRMFVCYSRVAALPAFVYLTTVANYSDNFLKHKSSDKQNINFSTMI